MSYHTSRRSAFSLIEMLIVLVILAQLTAILLPVLSRAREAARRASCAGNLKQIGLGIELYAADNDDYYPNRVAPIAGGDQVGVDQTCSWADRVLPYTKNTQIFVCPSSTNTPYIPGCVVASTTEKDDFGFFQSYDGAYDVVDLSTNAYFPHSATFTHPTATASVLDGRGAAISPTNKDMTTLEGLSTAGVEPGRHFSARNVLFLDGHIKWMQTDHLLVPSLWKAGD